MIKLVATDIDGTILGSSKEFTVGVRECISKLQQNGIKVVIVTGRMHAGAKKIAERLNLSSPVVSYNGGLIRDNDNNTLYEQFLPPDAVKEIIIWGRKNGVHLNLYTNDMLYSEKDNEEIRRYAEYQQLDYTVKNFSQIPYSRVYKLLGIDYRSPDTVTHWVDEMSEKFPDLYIVKSTPYFCEFSPKTSTKLCAVRFLQKYWGLNEDEVLTIGDQDNDIELLKAGGISVAMGNATETLKQYANYITGTVDNDGFVKAVERFVIGDTSGSAGSAPLDRDKERIY
ncbi:MAG: Cof-type HAD-IIB family hydrolase [Candidatus Gastranaerophilales bacterium]|nr:Cof-type HAD-IIB family hydrolase [Candidatus Gastranaerophilales bacterium]